MISKACEPCRRRKIKCDGEVICSGCQKKPATCTYRLKPRNRARKKNKDVQPEIPNPEGLPSDEGQSRLESQGGTYISPITALDHTPGSQSTRQLAYGPTSTFAFLQILYDELIHGRSHREENSSQNTQSLDVFIKRTIFFGLPSKVDAQSIPFGQKIEDILSKSLAIEYLQAFNTFSSHALPFVDLMRIQALLNELYGAKIASASSQDRALLLMTLAVGALSTSHTDTAETLLIHSKREIALFDDGATIQMVQISLMMADYQINMGRPNAAYLQVSMACTRALAMGLQSPPEHTSSGTDECQEVLTTLWVLYFYQTWICFMVGRKSILKKANICSPYPNDQPMLVDLCNLAAVVEEATSSPNDQKNCTLCQMYDTTRRLHLKSWEVCGTFWLRPNPLRLQGSKADMLSQLLVCNVYYHFIHTIYRPFLIAESALRAARPESADALWLRQACRYATDAAEDSLILTRDIFKSFQNSNGMRRYNAFFIETSCAVLLYDSISHPTKHPHHKEVICYAVKSLGLMINDDPVTNAIQHIQKIVNAVEDYLSRQQISYPEYSSQNQMHSGETSSFSSSSLHFHPTSELPFTSFLDLLPLDPSFLFSEHSGVDPNLLD
ncbi:hypothetical protein F53441_6768 [Fusarium austroafricanum]|uniref:Zn(2)-C6 fungal-type domain-containing protein n=1 Tax=Fusarium austroafricanum TaxID=2364996 RepID=A0A8H4NYA5_9HYPO|nr:hypothetical protein F53441_6768 [Fusarium austroafricanum]